MRFLTAQPGPRPVFRLVAVVWITVLAWFDPFQDGARAFDLDAQRKLVNKGVLGILGDGARGTDFAMIADLAILLDEGYDRRIMPMAGTGSVRAIEDLLLLRGVDVAFVQADVLEHYRKANLFPDLEKRLRYLARLYDKEFHLLASKDVTSIEDLEGKKVNFGPPSSGSFLTASLLFDALDITVEASDDTYQVALDKLRQGEIDAWVRVDAKPGLQMESLPDGEEVHFLPIPNWAIDEPYIAAELTSDDYPGLIADDNVIETLAVPTIMAVYAWPRKHLKRTQLSNFYDAMTRGLGRLQREPFHPKWRELDPDAKIAGWERF